MSKKSKIFALIASLIMGVSGTFAGCIGSGGKGPDNDTGVSSQMSISIKKNTVKRYESFMLSLETSLSGNVEWKSSDNSVAAINSVTVDEYGSFIAEIVGYKPGKATIEAIIGEEKASCEVTVVDSDYWPVIKFSADEEKLELISGSSYAINAKALANEFDIGATLTWRSENPAVADFVDGSIVAYSVGNTTIYCEFDYEGETIFRSIDVVVKSFSYVDFNASRVSLITRGTEAETQFTLVVNNVYANSVDSKENVSTIAYESSDEDVAVIEGTGENVTIKSTGRGEAIITATATLNDGSTVKGSLVVNVAPITITKDLGNYALNDATASFKHFSQEVEGTKLFGATINGVTVAENAYFIEDGVASIDYKTVSRFYGKNKTASFSTEIADYYYTLDIVTCLLTDASQFISDKSELPQYALAGGATTADAKSNGESSDTSTNNIFGYFLVGADIDFGGKGITHKQTIWDANSGFSGTLDGQGYTISNFSLGTAATLVGGLSEKAVIKNLNIVDFDNDGGYLFGWYLYGKFDNLFIKARSTNGPIIASTPVYCTSFTNSTVISPAADDVVAFTSDAMLQGASGTKFYTDGIVGENLAYSVECLPLTFTQDAVTDQNLVVAVSGVEKVIYGGQDVSSEEGVTLSADNIAFSWEFISSHRDYFEFKYNGFSRSFIATFDLQVVEKNVEVFAAKQTNESGTIIDNYFNATLDNVPVRLIVSKDGGVTGNEVVAYDYNDDTKELSVIGSVLTTADMSDSEASLIVDTASSRYIFKFNLFASFAITKVSDISSGDSKVASPLQTVLGYQEGAWGEGLTAILTCDLDFEGIVITSIRSNLWDSTYGSGFKGTIDGMGHALYNLDASNGFLDTVAGGVFQNIRFVGLTQQGNYGLSGWYNGIVFKNCYFDIIYCDYLGGSGEKLEKFGVSYAAMDNCIVINREEASDETNGVLGKVEYGGGFKITENTIVISDLPLSFNESLFDERLATKYGYTENVIELPETAENDAVFQISGAVRILENGVDVTSDSSIVAITADSITLKANAYSLDKIYTVIGVNFAKVIRAAIPVLTDVTVDMGEYVLNTATEEGKDLVIEGIEGTPKAVYFNYADKAVDGALAIEDLVYDEEAKTVTIAYEKIAGYYGPKHAVVVIETDTTRYTVNAVLVTLLITEASQINAGNGNFNQMQRVGGATANDSTTDSIYVGYYVLGNDIDFGGETIEFKRSVWYGEYGAIIELDGRGYSFKNFKSNIAFFDTLARTTRSFTRFGREFTGEKYSNIKNVGFIGETSSGYGLFGYTVSGTFDNCYFDITTTYEAAEGELAPVFARAYTLLYFSFK